MSASKTTHFLCGCQLTTGTHEGKETVMLRACKESCPTLRMMLEASDDAGKPVEIKSVMTLTVTCLGCGKKLDAAQGIGNDAVLPTPGSVSICVYCASVALYEENPDGDLYLRSPDARDQAALDADATFQGVLEQVRQVISER